MKNNIENKYCDRIKNWFEHNKHILAGIGSIATSIGVILALLFGVNNMRILKRNLSLTHNAVLYVTEPKTDTEKSKIIIPFVNSGNTKANNVKLGVYLLSFVNNKHKIERRGINPGKLEFYPKEEYRIELGFPKDKFIGPKFYFLICYAEYKKVDNAKDSYKSFFQYENKEWLQLGINQKSIKRYKKRLLHYSAKLKREVRK